MTMITIILTFLIVLAIVVYIRNFVDRRNVSEKSTSPEEISPELGYKWEDMPNLIGPYEKTERTLAGIKLYGYSNSKYTKDHPKVIKEIDSMIEKFIKKSRSHFDKEKDT